ncbi:MAG: HAD-IIIA family hydrolase, partial [Candidatus Hydrogenedentota bacterium]
FARFYLGNDNVHKHIARAVGIPTFTIFGPVGALSWTDPVFPMQYYFEKYIKCRKKCNINKCKDYKCIKEVEVAEVIQRLEIFLKEIEKEKQLPLPKPEPQPQQPEAGKTKIAVFIDRDGTINPDPGYINKPEEFELYPAAAEGIKLLNQAGILVFTLTNQSGVGRGYFTEEDLEKIHNKMIALLKEKDAYIDKIYYSTYYEDASDEKHRKNPHYRKPNPGLIYLARDEYGINVSRSYVIGDRLSDIETAKNAGCKSILVLTGNGTETLKEIDSFNKKPDFIVKDLLEASRLILDNLSY